MYRKTYPERLLDFPSESLIAAARTFLCLFAIAAVILGASAFETQYHLILITLGIYSAFALVQLLVLRRATLPHLAQLFAHGLDIMAVSILMALTDGPTSPFFVFFTFILLAGTVRWNWEGALATVALLAVTYVMLAMLVSGSDGGEDLTRTIIRAAFLVVAGAMLGYVGAHSERGRNRLAQLVAWPGPSPSLSQVQDQAPPLQAALSHAAALVHASRILLIWEQRDEPYREVIIYENHNVRYIQVEPDRFGEIVAPGWAGSAARLTWPLPLRPAPGTRDTSDPLDLDLRETFGITNALTAAFEGELCSGHVFILDPATSTDDDLLLVQLIASHLGLDLEHHLLRHQIEAAAILQERVRLGRDLHDGLLQGLAAANIQLKLSAAQASGDTKTALEGTRTLLTKEQQRIRQFVEEHRPQPPGIPDRVPLAREVEEPLRNLGYRLQCEVSIEVASDITVAPDLVRQVYYLCTEAISNSVRHGSASRAVIRIAQVDSTLTITITDNGKGIPRLSGFYNSSRLDELDLGPRSIRARVRELGGTISLETGPDGTHIELKVKA